MKIDVDHQLIENHICPVCNLNVGELELKDRRRSLKQHISRAKTAKHRLWCELYWKHHFKIGGYRIQPKCYTLQDIIQLTKTYFGEDVAFGLQTRIEQAEHIDELNV
jgi:hypothetical protein